MSIILSQNPGMIKISEEDVLKAKRAQKVGLLCQFSSCECKEKVLKENEKCYFNEHMN